MSRDLADVFRGLESRKTPRHVVPVVALHGAVVGLHDWNRDKGAERPAVLAEKPERVGQDAMAGRGVEGTALRVLDAGIVVERSLLRAAGVVNALGSRKRIDVRMKQIQVVGVLPEQSRVR